MSIEADMKQLETEDALFTRAAAAAAVLIDAEEMYYGRLGDDAWSDRYAKLDRQPNDGLGCRGD